MLRALLRKQWMELNTWALQNRKTGQNRGKGQIVGLMILYVLLFLMLGGFFFFMASMLCSTLVSLNLGWYYFFIITCMAVLFGVFGSVFSTYSTLYTAKDNELLLSMPIPPSYILFVRLFGVWFWSLLYEALVWVPGLICYWIVMSALNQLTVMAVIGGIVQLFLLSFFILMLSCLLGYVVAKISRLLKNRSFVTVFVSLVFFAAYYFFYSRSAQILQQILNSAAVMSAKIKGSALPLYWVGRASEGDWFSLLMVTVIVAVLFLGVCFVLSRSYIKLASSGQQTVRKEYAAKGVKRRSVDGALLYKESRRFFTSPTYMLNCGLSIVFLPILTVLAIVYAPMIYAMADQISAYCSPALLACGVLAMTASMNDISAPSVSLEGSALWQLQVLPVDPYRILLAKLKWHWLMTLPPTLLLSVCLVFVLPVSELEALMMIVFPSLFVLMIGEIGLVANLKMPNLTWKNEIIPIKQGGSVMLTLFGAWGILIMLAVLCVLAIMFLAVPAVILLAVFSVLIGIVCLLLRRWLKDKGTKIWMSL